MKKPKKPSLGKLRRKAFQLWAELVRKDKCCEICQLKKGEIGPNGKPIILHSHHLIGRENHALAFDIKNGVPLCIGHHKFYKDSAHKGGLLFHDWFMKKYPERYEYLLQNSTKSFDNTIENLLNIIKELTEQLSK